MNRTTQIAIEHIALASHRSSAQVKAFLEARMGVAGDLDEMRQQLAAVNGS